MTWPEATVFITAIIPLAGLLWTIVKHLTNKSKNNNKIKEEIIKYINELPIDEKLNKSEILLNKFETCKLQNVLDLQNKIKTNEDEIGYLKKQIKIEASERKEIVQKLEGKIEKVYEKLIEWMMDSSDIS